MGGSNLMRRIFAAIISGFLLAVTIAGALIAQVSTLRKITQIELPGPKGKRFDYLTVDPDDHFVIVAHMRGDQTYFVDTRTNQVPAPITGTPPAARAQYIPQAN